MKIHDLEIRLNTDCIRGVSTLVLLFIVCTTASMVRAVTVAGDVAPYGNPDGVLDISDLGIVMQFLTGEKVPNGGEQFVCDVAPVGAPDSWLDINDYLLLQKAVHGRLVIDPLPWTSPPILWGDAVSPASNTYRLSGIAEPGIEVRLYRDGVFQMSGTADSHGLFSFSAGLDDGSTHQFHVTGVREGYESSSSGYVTATAISRPPSVDLQAISITYGTQDTSVDGQAGSVAANAVVVINRVDGSSVSVGADKYGAFVSSLPGTAGIASIRQVTGSGVLSEPAFVTAVGTTAGEISVDPSGAATYTIPITVPPGTAGMAPGLSLNFSSRHRNGLLGNGWSLEGLSSITRCPRTIAQDGIPGAINLDANDRFCLEGQRLIAINGGIYGADQTEYRTEIETFTKVISYGGTGSSPDYFMAWTRSGQIIRYGFTTDSGFNPGGGSDLLWSADRWEDRSGNYITATYHEDAALGEHYLLEVVYTGNEAAGLSPYNRVRFVYEGRPDTSAGYVGGQEVLHTQRLGHVHVYEGATVIRDYRLSYDTGPVTGISRLKSISECDSSHAMAACMQPTRFEWTGGSHGYMNGLPAGSMNVASSNVHVMDVNGDGIQDLVLSDGGYWRLKYGSNTGFLPETSSGISTAGTHSDRAIQIDYNSDGINDLLVPGLNGDWDLLQSDGNVLQQSGSVLRSAGYDTGPEVLDMNGDGRHDLLVGGGASVYGSPIHHVYHNSPSGFSSPVDTKLGVLSYYERVFDYDNDGISDLLVPFSYYNNCTWWLMREAGAIYSYDAVSSTAGCLEASRGENVMLGDINGDGLTDLVSPQNNGSEFGFALNTGSGFNAGLVNAGLSAVGDWVHAKPIDYNSDGRLDIILPKSGNWVVYQSTGSNFVEVDMQLPSAGHQGAYIMDVNGDGMQDIVSPYAGIWHVFQRAGPYPDQLTGITNGLGAKTAITYKPLTDSTVYSKGSSAVFPEQDYQGAVYVVSATDVDDGTGGRYRTDYSYAGARIHLQGRGLLGFNKVSVTDPQTGISTTTNYRQDFPFIGMVASVETSLNGILLDKSTNMLEAVSNINSHAGVHFPYVRQSVRESHDLPVNSTTGSGALIKTVTTESVYEVNQGGLGHFGNPARITVTTADAGNDLYTRVTDFVYEDPDPGRWITDRVMLTSVRHGGNHQAAVTRTSGFSYYPSGLLHEEIIEPGSGAGSPLYKKTTYEYDGFGNRVRVTVTGLRGYEPAAGTENRMTETRYDSSGRYPLWTRNALDHLESYIYDERFGVRQKMTGPNGLATVWGHDSFGRTVSEVRPDGAETTWDYAFCHSGDCPNGGFAETVTSSDGGKSRTLYDARQRVIRTETTGLNGGLIYQDTVYDSRGNVSGKSQPYFPGGPVTAQQVTTYFNYDALNRPESESAPDGGLVSYAYTGFARNTTRSHASDDYPPQTDVRINNVLEQLVSVIQQNIARFYHYDAAGNLTVVSDNIDLAQAGNVISMAYDLRGRKISMDDPDMGYWSYRYNAFDELVWQKDAKGQVVTMAYDKLGRMVSRDEAEGISSWEYDTAATGIGRLARAHNPASGHTRILLYDNLGRLSAETSSIDSELFTMAYTYDSFSRPDTVVYPTGFIIRNLYNQYGYLYEVRSAAEDNPYWKAVSSDPGGRIVSETLGNGLQTVRAYDPANGSIKAISTGFGATSAVQHLEYIFDALGNLKQRKDMRTVNSHVEKFTYDSLNRLETATILNVGVRTYKYDLAGLGNIRSKSDYGDQYNYGDSGAGPHAVTGVKSGGVTVATYTYDSNGNMTGGDGRNIVWTSFNKARVISRGADSLEFFYDADHSRVKQVNGNSTIYYINPHTYTSVKFEKTVLNGVEEYAHYIPAGDRVVAIFTKKSNETDKVRYLHTDHLGSTDVVTDEGGQVAERQSFSPFGGRRHADWGSFSSVMAGIETHHGFTGHEHLDSFGIIHMNGRLYDPKLGRFLSPDIQVQYKDQTQSFNRYTYVNNNPLSFTDPGGFGFFSSIWKSIKSAFRKVAAFVTAAVVGYITFGWGGVYWGSMAGALITGASFAGFTYGLISGGIQGAIKGAVMAFGISSAITNLYGISRSVLSGLKSVLEATVKLTDALVHVVKWSGHQFVQLKTRQEFERFAKRNGMSLMEMNLSLLGLSFAAKYSGYDRIRIGEGDANFGETKDQPGIRGWFSNGGKWVPADLIDTMLTFQGIPSAQGLGLAISCGGQVNSACLGSTYRDSIYGHSLGAAEVSVMKGLGLINKSVGIHVFSLPFTRIAPPGVDAYQGSHDLVNLGIFGHVTNIGSKLVGQSSVRASGFMDYHHCNPGYAGYGCGR